MKRITKRIGEGVLVAALAAAVLAGAIYAAKHIANDPAAQEVIASAGYAGVAAVAVIAGLNVIVPAPAASFVPIFTAAGLWLPLIILSLTIGTLAADYIGFLLGRWGRTKASDKYPKLTQRFEDLYFNHRRFVWPVLLLYVAFAPLPNEVILLPLAVAGAKFRYLLLPLFFGNLVNQAIFSYGAQNIFSWAF